MPCLHRSLSTNGQIPNLGTVNWREYSISVGITGITQTYICCLLACETADDCTSVWCIAPQIREGITPMGVHSTPICGHCLHPLVLRGAHPPTMHRGKVMSRDYTPSCVVTYVIASECSHHLQIILYTLITCPFTPSTSKAIILSLVFFASPNQWKGHPRAE